MNLEITLQDVAMLASAGSDPLFLIPSLVVEPGSCILIHGPSGTGKSTLLHLLAGQFLPDRGRIQVGGRDFAALGEDGRSLLRRRHFGIVFQRLNLVGHLSARENILLGCPPDHDLPDLRVRASLERMGLAPLAGRRAGTLSLGEQQRLAVARILARTPDIILADEPTSSLDRANAENVIEALVESALGRTLIVVSHDERIRRRFGIAWDFSRWVAR